MESSSTVIETQIPAKITASWYFLAQVRIVFFSPKLFSQLNMINMKLSVTKIVLTGKSGVTVYSIKCSHVTVRVSFV